MVSLSPSQDTFHCAHISPDKDTTKEVLLTSCENSSKLNSSAFYLHVKPTSTEVLDEIDSLHLGFECASSGNQVLNRSLLLVLVLPVQRNKCVTFQVSKTLTCKTKIGIGIQKGILSEIQI